MNPVNKWHDMSSCLRILVDSWEKPKYTWEIVHNSQKKMWPDIKETEKDSCLHELTQECKEL